MTNSSMEAVAVSERLKVKLMLAFDPSELFDRVREVGDGGNALGTRLVQTMLSSGHSGFVTAVGMASYGVTLEPTPAQAAEPEHDLWCINVQGPDDVYPAPDFWTALAWAAEINAAIAKRAIDKKWAADPEYPRAQAIATRWPWSPERHEAGLALEMAKRAAHEEHSRAVQTGEAAR